MRDARARCRRCRPRPARRAPAAPVGAHHVAHVGEVAHGVQVARPSARGGRRPASISAIWRAKELSAKASPRPGPVWWKVRVQHHRACRADRRTAAPGSPAPPCSPRRARRAAAARPRAAGSVRGCDRRRTPRRCPPPARAAAQAAPAQRLQQVQRARARSCAAWPPGSSQERCTLDCAGQVDDAVGPDLGSSAASHGGAGPRGRPSSDVDPGRQLAARVAARRAPGRRPRPAGMLGAQEVDEVAAHEAADAGDEDLHARAVSAL